MSICARHDLTAPDLDSFVGLSLQYADYQMRYGQADAGPPSIVSTVKINQAEFTEIMFRKRIGRARARRWTT